MRNIILTSLLLCAVIFTGCLSDVPYIHNEPDVNDTGDTYIRLNTATTPIVEHNRLTINTMRVLIFQDVEGESESVLRTNRLVSSEESGYNFNHNHWIITTTAPFITHSGLSRVYVVLNEAEAINNGDNGVANPLENAVLTESELIAFFSDLLSYEPIDRGYGPELQLAEEDVERPFPMIVFDAVNILGGHSADRPFEIDLTGMNGAPGFPMERPMAKITLTEATNESLNPNAPTRDGNFDLYSAFYAPTSLIFILEMGIRETRKEFSWAPATWQWNDDRTGLETATRPITDGNYRENLHFFMKDPEEYVSGYYFKDWDGSIEFEIAGSLRQEMHLAGGGRVYWTGNTGSDPVTIDRVFAVDVANGTINSHHDRALHRAADFLSEVNDDLIVDLTVGDLFDAMTDDELRTRIVNSRPMSRHSRPAGLHHHFSWSSHFEPDLRGLLQNLPSGNFEVRPWRPRDTAIGDMNVTGGVWTLKDTPMSFYVPERILQDNNNDVENAKILYVEAAQVTKNSIVQGGGITIPEPGDGTEWRRFAPREESYYREREDITGDLRFFRVTNIPGVSTPPSNTFEYARLGFGLWVEEGFAGIIDDDIPGMWRFELIYRDGTRVTTRPTTVQELNNMFILHYWSTGVYRWRYIDADGTMPFDLSGISTEIITQHSEPKTFDVPLSNAGFGDADNFNIYRNRHYNFSLHFQSGWANEDNGNNNNGGGTRSTTQPAGFMVLRAE